jgi:hypothetical protein
LSSVPPIYRTINATAISTLGGPRIELFGENRWDRFRGPEVTYMISDTDISVRKVWTLVGLRW